MTLKVSDGELTGTGTAQVQVEDYPTLPGGEGGSMPPVPPWGFGPPIARAIVPSSIETGDTLVLDGSTSSDPDNDLLTYEWDLNDDGTWDVQGASPSISWATLKASYGYVKGSMKTVRLQVTDDDGFTSQDSASVMVNMPVVSITGPGQSLKESTTGNGGGSFTVSRTGATDEPLTVSLYVAGTAVADVDYSAIPSSVLIPVGQSSVDVPVTVLNDRDVEFDEQVVVTTYTTIDYNVGSDFSALMTILSNDKWEWGPYSGDTPSGSSLSQVPGLNPIGGATGIGSHLASSFQVAATSDSITVSLNSTLVDVDLFSVNQSDASDSTSMNFAFDPVSGTIYQAGGSGGSSGLVRNGSLEAKAAVAAIIDNTGNTQHTVTLNWHLAAAVTLLNEDNYGIKLELLGYPLIGAEIKSVSSLLAGGVYEKDGTITLALNNVEIAI